MQSLEQGVYLSRAVEVDGPQALRRNLAEVVSSLVRHAHHRDDGASSRYTPF